MVGVGERERLDREGGERRDGWLSSWSWDWGSCGSCRGCNWEVPSLFWEDKDNLVAEGLRGIFRGPICGRLRAVGGEEGRWILGPIGRAGLECIECIVLDDDKGVEHDVKMSGLRQGTTDKPE